MNELKEEFLKEVNKSKLTPEEIHKIAKAPLPSINIIKPLWIVGGNRIAKDNKSSLYNDKE